MAIWNVEETKGKISYYNSNLKTYSDETRKKISDSKIGIKRAWMMQKTTLI